MNLSTLACFIATLALPISAHACMQQGEAPLFYCEAMAGHKYIELCSADLGTESESLVYRFGELDDRQREKTVELEYPRRREGSLQHFFGATYPGGNTVRFVSGGYSYTVFHRARNDPDPKPQQHAVEDGAEENPEVESAREEFGVEVRNRSSGKRSTVFCSERPRFYIYELKGRVPCDPETPVGTACID